VFGQEAEEPTEDVLTDMFTEEQRDQMAKSAENFHFQAETTRLLDILIHSLYSDRDIFLRELISNAGDALDKIRFVSLTEKSAMDGQDDLKVFIKPNEQAHTLSIRDTGIGMSKQELVDNLGRIAASGTAKFLESLESQDSLNLIGQFGVGFYSAFLVADEVEVITKSYKDDKQWIWRSKADGSFSITEDPRGNTLGRGTEILLHLRDDSADYLQQTRLETIVSRYSEFLTFPIELWTTRTEEREVPIEEDEEETETETDEDLEISEEETEEKPKMKTVTETIEEWKHLNEHAPLWTRSKDEITDGEYIDFYKTITKNYDEPLDWVHFKAEGEIDFDSLLYIPSRPPPGLYDNYYQNPSKLRLYVRRVLVNDQFDDLIPRYLNFVGGLVDSNDLPLNVNREQLARSKTLRVVGKKLTKKVLDVLRKLANQCSKEDEESAEEAEAEEEEGMEPEDNECKYTQFFREFGKSIKLGIMEDSSNKKRLSDLLRFESSKSNGKLISLDDYVERMGEKQKDIYFIAGESVDAVKASPFMDKFLKRDIEVLYFVDPLDEYVSQHLMDYDGHRLQAVTKEGIKLDKDNKAHKKYMEDLKKEYESFTDWLKELFSDRVDKVVVTDRLQSAPCVLSTAQWGWSANMERIAKAQAFGSKQNSMFMSKKTLEINTRHPIIRQLKELVAEDPDSVLVKDQASLLFDAALLDSGFSLDSTGEFTGRIHTILRHSLDIPDDAEVEEEQVFPEDPEEDEPAEQSLEELVDLDLDNLETAEMHDEL
jgi:heat shock protein beta